MNLPSFTVSVQFEFLDVALVHLSCLVLPFCFASWLCHSIHRWRWLKQFRLLWPMWTCTMAKAEHNNSVARMMDRCVAWAAVAAWRSIWWVKAIPMMKLNRAESMDEMLGVYGWGRGGRNIDVASSVVVVVVVEWMNSIHEDNRVVSKWMETRANVRHGAAGVYVRVRLFKRSVGRLFVRSFVRSFVVLGFVDGRLWSVVVGWELASGKWEFSLF